MESGVPLAKSRIVGFYPRPEDPDREGRRSLEILPALIGTGAGSNVLSELPPLPRRGNRVVDVGAETRRSGFQIRAQTGIPYRVTQTKDTQARFYLKMQTEISRVLKLVIENAPKKAPERPLEKIVL
jgi:hypothetical protein